MKPVLFGYQRVRASASAEEVAKGRDALVAFAFREGFALGEVFVSLVQTGEVSSSLDDVLAHTAAYLERAELLRLKVEAALRYGLVGALAMPLLVVPYPR